MIVTVLGLVSAFVCSLVSYMPLARIRFYGLRETLAFIGGKRDIRNSETWLLPWCTIAVVP